MSYTDLRDFEPEYTYTASDGSTVQVEKLGGGMVGRKYAGTWRYILSDADGVELTRGQDYTVGMPHTHAWVAEDIREILRRLHP